MEENGPLLSTVYERASWLTGCLLNVPATSCKVCLGDQSAYPTVLPDRQNLQINFLSTPVRVYWHLHGVKLIKIHNTETRLGSRGSAPMGGLGIVCCLTSQQHASVSQGRICSDNFTCCHTEIEVEDQTFHLTQSQYTDTGPTSPSADPITPGAWQGSHWSANFKVTDMTRPQKTPALAGCEPGTFRSRGGRLNH